MAVSAVYVSITRITLGSQSGDQHIELNISATTAPFNLKGGLYEIKAMGTAFGTLSLQAMADDQTAYLLQATAIVANGTALVYCSEGLYRWALA